MFRRPIVLFFIVLALNSLSVGHADPVHCPEAAADRAYRPLSFRSVEARDAFGTSHELLGVYAPNPLCYLSDIASRAKTSATEARPRALRGIYTLTAHACAAGARAGDANTHEMVCELPRIIALYQTARSGSAQLLRELALQNALKMAAAWVQTRPHRSAFMDARAAVASAELWTDRPIQAVRALFTTLICAEAEPMSLNTCRLQKDILAIALKNALASVEDQAALALNLLRQSRRVQDAPLKSILAIAEASHEVARLLAIGVRFEGMMTSSLPELFDRYRRQAHIADSDVTARAAAQATEELASLIMIAREVAAHEPTYPKIAEAQTTVHRSSPELAALDRVLSVRGQILSRILRDYLADRLRLSTDP